MGRGSQRGSSDRLEWRGPARRRAGGNAQCGRGRFAPMPRPPPRRSRAEGWVDVRIPLGAFLMTHKGRLVERRMEMPRDRVISVGVSFSALAAPDPDAEARSGVRRRPAAGGGGGGDDGGRAVEDGGAAGQEQGAGQQREAPAAAAESGALETDERGDAAARAVDFLLLLREIRAEGRAGVAGGPEE